MATFKIDNYIVVPGFAVVNLGLSGNELLCYSLIYGFAQDEETEFSGSLSYVASALNVTKQNAKAILDRLVGKGLITKKEVFISGVKFCHYVINNKGVIETITPPTKQDEGVIETITGGVIETTTNNTNKDNSTHKDNIPAEGDLFPASEEFTPVVVTRPRKTSEGLCLFENSKFVDYARFENEFRTVEFQGIDILYYYHAVADWSAQKGKKMRDWIATARNFIRRDIENGKVHRLPKEGGSISRDEIENLQILASL